MTPGNVRPAREGGGKVHGNGIAREGGGKVHGNGIARRLSESAPAYMSLLPTKTRGEGSGIPASGNSKRLAMGVVQALGGKNLFHLLLAVAIVVATYNSLLYSRSYQRSVQLELQLVHTEVELESRELAAQKMEQQVKQLTVKELSLKQELRQRDQDIAALKREKTDLTTQIEELHKAIKTALSQMEAAQVELTQKKAQVREMTQTAERKSTDSAMVNQKLALARESLGDCTRKLEACSGNLKSREEEVMRLQEELSSERDAALQHSRAVKDAHDRRDDLVLKTFKLQGLAAPQCHHDGLNFGGWCGEAVKQRISPKLRQRANRTGTLDRIFRVLQPTGGFVTRACRKRTRQDNRLPEKTGEEHAGKGTGEEHAGDGQDKRRAWHCRGQTRQDKSMPEMNKTREEHAGDGQDRRRAWRKRTRQEKSMPEKDKTRQEHARKGHKMVYPQPCSEAQGNITKATNTARNDKANGPAAGNRAAKHKATATRQPTYKARKQQTRRARPADGQQGSGAAKRKATPTAWPYHTADTATCRGPHAKQAGQAARQGRSADKAVHAPNTEQSDT
ncbi:hypothetical protein CBR_g3102 [Chara braunii]|uniref:Uncharacterized protein n=1 Tax=Chara braunii TaxID=69332 RepID=A0A388KES7_CHABU|nr:hypothetical protein CBR_g3102 [Chara braunii]|eukprot:GBG68558.1 hypothetical protein CBR_g3102 [Chara braunii]